MLLGAGLLWFGWFGFNGGSAFGVNDAGVLAFVNTLLTPAATLGTWMVLDLIRGRQVTAIGAATAIVVGCVGITPAAGFISPGWALVLGVVAALPSYAVILLRPRSRVDETLDVLAAHGVAGLHGHPLHRLLRPGELERDLPTARSTATSPSSATRRSPRWRRPPYAFAMTFVLLKLVGAFMPLRATAHEEAIGMDEVCHGEEAYPSGEGAILVMTEPRAKHEDPQVADAGLSYRKSGTRLSFQPPCSCAAERPPSPSSCSSPRPRSRSC